MERSTATSTVRTGGGAEVGLPSAPTAPETTLIDVTTPPRPVRLDRPTVETRRMVVDGVAFVHQRFYGPSPLGPPAALLQHFPTATDEWDPMAPPYTSLGRELILMEHPDRPAEANTGEPDLGGLARGSLEFIDVLELGEVDLLGFALGVGPAEDVVLLSPRLVQRLVAASEMARGTAPRGRSEGAAS